MNDSLKKFKLFLSEFSFKARDAAIGVFNKSINDQISKDELKKHADDLWKTAMTLTTIDRVINSEESLEIVENFYTISKLLEEAHFRPKDNFNILMFFINKNATFNKENGHETINFSEIQTHKFKKYSSSEIDFLISNGDIQRIIASQDEALTEKERKLKQEIYDNKNKLIIKTQTISEISNEIYSLYQNDINEQIKTRIIELFKQLGVTEKILESLEIFLNKKVEKNIKNNIQITLQPKDKTQIVKKCISNTDYKNIQKEIREIYNLTKGEIVKVPTYDKMIHIAALMYLIDIDESIIRNFILLVIQLIPEKSYASSIEEYLDNNKKINFYYQEEYQEVLDYYNQTQVTQGEEYELYCELIQEFLELHKIDKSNIEYELSLSKKISKEMI